MHPTSSLSLSLSSFGRTLFLASGLMALLALPLFAQPREARNLMNELKRQLRNRRAPVEQVVSLIEQLRNYPHLETTKFVVEDVLPALHPSDRPEMADAYTAAVNALDAVAQDNDSRAYLDQQMFNDRLPGSLRVVALSGRINQNAATPEMLARALSDSAWQMRVAALNQVGKNEPEARFFDAVKASLGHDNFRVRAAALEVLNKYVKSFAPRSPQHLAVLEAMIEQLSKEQTRLKGDLIEALTAIAGADHGVEAVSWRNWLAGYRQGSNQGPSGGAQTGSPNHYYGIRTFAKKFIYVLDMSVSMEERLHNKDDIRRKIGAGGVGVGLNWDEIHNRFDLARAELIRAIRALEEPRPGDIPARPARTDHQTTVAGGGENVAAFTIIAYSDDVVVWKEALQPATRQNKDEAVRWLQALRPGSLTNIWGAMNRAFEIAEGKFQGGGGVITGDVRATVDTIYLLTDGYATHGKYGANGQITMRQLDTNNDGFLSKDEFMAGFSTDFIDAQRIENLFNRFDSNRDGKLSDNEFVGNMAQYYSLHMDGMLAEIRQRNQMLKTKIHTIGIGDHDSRTLAAISGQNGGQYVNVGR